MLTVALINTKDTARARYLLGCFRRGIEVHGDRCVDVYGNNDMEYLARADVAVQVCYVNAQHAGNPQDLFRIEAYRTIKRLNKRLLIIDTGFVKNQIDYQLGVKTLGPFHTDHPETFGPLDGEIYYEVGYDGIKGRACYYNDKVGPDRWLALGVKIAPWRTGGRHVLILGQVYHGQSSQHVDIRKWYADAVRRICIASKRQIIMRQHPRIASLRGTRRRVTADRQLVLAEMGIYKKRLEWSENIFLADDLRGAWAAVAFSTNAAVGAVLGGIPVFAGDHGCMAYQVSNNDLSRIEVPKIPDREAWAHSLAYAQWNSLEMRDGSCWAHLRPYAKLAPRYSEVLAL